MIVEQMRVRYFDTEMNLEYRFEPVEGSLSTQETESGFEARYLTRDDDAESPDEGKDGNLFLVHYHRDLWVTRDKIITEDDVREYYRGIGLVPHLEESYWIFPVAAYIHSGVRLSLGSGRNFPDSQWDVSRVGLVLVSKEEWTKEEEAKKVAECLIAEWNQHLSGDVYCIVKEVFDQYKAPLDYDIVGGYSGKEYALGALKTDI